MSKCLRCGECCKLPDGSDCRFLKRLTATTTECIIYNHRLGMPVAPGIVCAPVGDPNQLGHANNCPYF